MRRKKIQTTHVNTIHDKQLQSSLSMRQQIRRMDIEKKMIKMLFSIEKEAMHSCLYHDKNLIDVSERFTKHGVDMQEQQIIFDSMGLRHNIAKDLLKDLEGFISEFKARK